MNERLAQIAQSAEPETLDHRVAGSSLHEKLQKLQMITTSSSNNSPTSLECHDCPAIRRTSTPCTSTPCSQPAQPEHDATPGTNCDGHLDNLQDVSSLSSYGQSANDEVVYSAFPETSGKFIASFHQHSTKGCYPMSPKTRQRGMRKPKYNCKFTGCMRSKRKLSVEWISNNNQRSLCMGNGQVESLCVVQRKSQRQSHSNADLYDRMQQYTPTPVTVPATAHNGTSITSARVHARRAFPAMSTCSLAQQHGTTSSSPTTAYLPEIEWDVAATNALYTVSLLQNVGLNTLYSRARNRESMLQSYIHSFERRPKV